MTVIVAIPTGDSVIMACDTALIRRDTFVGKVNKIALFRVGPDYEQRVLLGMSGSRALADVAFHDFGEQLNLPQLKSWEEARAADHWALAVARRLCKLAATAEPPLLVDDTEVDAEALLAPGPHLWLVSGLSAVRLSTPFAIGSGADVARGSLYASGELGLAKSYPHDALRLAVRAAVELNAFCGGDVGIESTQRGEDG